MAQLLYAATEFAHVVVFEVDRPLPELELFFTPVREEADVHMRLRKIHELHSGFWSRIHCPLTKIELAPALLSGPTSELRERNTVDFAKGAAEMRQAVEAGIQSDIGNGLSGSPKVHSACVSRKGAAA